MKAPSCPKNGHAQTSVRVWLRHRLAASLKDPRPGPHMRVTREAGETVNFPGGFAWVQSRENKDAIWDPGKSLPGRPLAVHWGTQVSCS